MFSAIELRNAYHGPRVIFAASDCLRIRWNDAHSLTVSCHDGLLDTSHIENIQQHQSGDVAIAYVNIPDINRGARRPCRRAVGDP
jgi:hypothetical protein